MSLVTKDVELGDYEEALTKIFHLCSHLRDQSELEMQKVHLPCLDELILSIGERLYRECEPKPLEALKRCENIFVATEIYPIGGHTRLILDITRNLKAPAVIILTDIFENYKSSRMSLEHFQELGLDIEIIVLSGVGLVEKITKLRRLLMSFSPSNIWIAAHHEDVVAYTACRKFDCIFAKMIYLHHCNYNPTLGATRQDYIHVDLMQSDVEMCRDTGMVKPILLPLHVELPERLKPVEAVLRSSNFKTATSTRSNKIVFKGPLAYQKIVSSIISTTQSKHYHVGDLSVRQIEIIQNELKAEGLDHLNFVHIGIVQSVSQALLDLGIDIYISSAPTVGGKTLIEALAAGIPVLSYANSSSDFILDRYQARFLDKEIGTWSSLNELEIRLQEFDLEESSNKVRNLYNNKYSRDAFVRAISSIISV